MMFTLIIELCITMMCTEMGVHNTTGAVNTLFICLAVLVGMVVYRLYCRAVGNQDNDSVRPHDLIRAGGWFTVDISMVLNAMTRGRGVTNLMRMQQCTPPHVNEKGGIYLHGFVVYSTRSEKVCASLHL